MRIQMVRHVLFCSAVAGCMEAGEQGPSASKEELPIETGHVMVDGKLTHVAFQRDGDRIVVDGDMMYLAAEFDAALVDEDGTPKHGQSEAAARSLATRRWPNGVIPFEIDPALGPNQVAAFNAAVAHWEALTPFDFVARTTQTDFVRITTIAANCRADVGRIGGQQVVQLSTTCGTSALIHELGHTIGMWHEQARSDRDNFISVNFDCINSDVSEANWQTYVVRGQDGVNIGPYDYKSKMHYQPAAFGNGCNPITPLMSNAFYQSQPVELSLGDILGAHFIRSGVRPGFKVYAADHDGDGKADLGVKTDTGLWRINLAIDGFTDDWDVKVGGYGGATYVAVPADYDGDGKADIAVKGLMDPLILAA